MCGLEIDVEDEQRHADPGRPRRRVDARATCARRARRSATCTTTPTASASRWCATATRGARSRWDEAFARCEELHPRRDRARRHRGGHRVHRQPDRPQLLARPLRRAVHRPGRASRMIYSSGTVDQWPKNVSSRPHVRRTCGRSRPRRPAHRLPRRAWAPTRRRRRVSCSPAPTCSARSTASAPRRQGRRRRPAPHRHRRSRRRMDADRPRHRRRLPARDRQRAVRRRSGRPRRRSPTW